MKTTMLVILCVVAGLVQAKHQKQKSRLHHKMTPKGESLSNHYGSNTFSNVYGPRPELVMRDAYVKNQDGSVARKRLRFITGLASNGVQNSCDLTSKPNYYFCLTISNCDLCSAVNVCGWCEITKQCLPGNIKDMACPGGCMNGWVFSRNNCDGIVRSGSIENTDPIGTEKLQTVEYSQPKYRLESIVHTPEVVTTPVILGTISENHLRQKRDVNNYNTLVSEQGVTVNKPVYGEVRRVMDVKTHNLQYLDARTGQRVDSFGQKSVAFHGMNDYNVVSDPEDDYDHSDERSIFSANPGQPRH